MRKVIVLTIIMTVSFVASVILLIMQSHGIDTVEIRTVEVNRRREIEVTERLESIVVNVRDVTRVNILATEGNNIIATLIGTYDTVLERRVNLAAYNRGGILEMTAGQTGFFRFINVGDYQDNLILNIYVPVTYMGRLELIDNGSNIYIHENVIGSLQFYGRVEPIVIRNPVELPMTDIPEYEEVVEYEYGSGYGYSYY